MFVMTETAGGLLTRILQEANAADDTAVRLVLEGEDVKPMLDSVKPGDDVFAHAGRKVLVIDKSVARALDSSVLDTKETREGRKLVLMH